ncbi:MAG: tRNA (guanosine(37)-N1)-methyltransferase TrmD [Elusimicrobia bacterium RIFCSPHIGHO2_02_FULL_57_9]|nr:MAG: tRNA (guanosine(37)-N1)-methyltransferase TrmD [Elusimicrobia bacterium RIFCSPHIGHO2_02_FULL_57_9]
MTKIDFVTLFPGMFASVVAEGLLARARGKGLLETGFVNPRDFSPDKRRKVDERPYGGGAGMVMTPEPLYAAIKSAAKRGSRVVYLSPQGRPFNEKVARRLAKVRQLVLVCGHYEGIDERVMGLFNEEISIGDYVLSGGELAAMVVADAVTRWLPGMLKKEGAVEAESFSLTAGQRPLLEYPQYTRPKLWRSKKVPEVLLSGNHGKVAEWRLRAATLSTKRKRPDLLKTVRSH